MLLASLKTTFSCLEDSSYAISAHVATCSYWMFDLASTHEYAKVETQEFDWKEAGLGLNK